MIPYAIYDPLTGRILRTGTAPLLMVAIQAQEGERVMSLDTPVSDATHYVTDIGSIVPRAVPKPALGAVIDKTTVTADGVDSVTISGLPIPTDYRLSGPVNDSATIDDGAITLTLDFPGDYSVELRALNRMAQTLTITGF